MSTASSISVAVDLSLLATFDDINRCNNVLNDGAAEECFLRFVKHQEWCRQQWASSVAEGLRLKRELDAALTSVSSLEHKFIHARKLLDAEKRHRRIAEEDRIALEKQMMTARDLLFNDNRNKLNDETLEKLQFLNNTSRSYHAGDYQNANVCSANPRLNVIPELNSTGTLLSDQSVSRSEDDLDVSMATNRRSWRQAQKAPTQASNGSPPASGVEGIPAKKRRSSGRAVTSSWSNADGGVIATATTTLTIQHSDPALQAPVPAVASIKRELSCQSPRSAVPTEVSSKGSTKASSPTAPPRQPDSGSDYCSDSGLVHSWANKTVIKPEPCSACGKRIMFAKAAFRCHTCRSLVHSHCKALAPLTCTPRSPRPAGGTPRTPQTPQRRLRIAECVPASTPHVPPLIVYCANEVETRGLVEVGLYRVPGSEREVRELKQRLLNGDASRVHSADVHALCSCLKDFLRGLEEPIVSKASRSQMISAAASGTTSSLRRLFSELPDANRHTLAFILLHLRRVGAAEACKMPVKNLAMVFAPTLIGYESGSADICPADVYEQSKAQVTLMESLLALPLDWLAEQMGQVQHVLHQRRQSPPHTTSDDRSSPEREHAPPRGFFYSPISSSHSVSRRQRKFYAT